MSHRVDEILDRELSQEARAAVRRNARNLALFLIYEARALALRKHNDEVQSSDVQEAWENLTRRRVRSHSQQLASVIGGSLFGAFVKGFSDGFSSENTLLMGVYTILGLIGMMLVFFGVTR